MKRLRVRLRAENPVEFRRSFAHRLGSDQVRLPLQEGLRPGDRVEILLLYKNRQLALSGKGQVRECRNVGRRSEAIFQMDWSAQSRPLLNAILALDAVAPPPETQSLHQMSASLDLSSDLSLPVPKDVAPPSGIQDWTPDSTSAPDAFDDDRDTGEVTPLARIELVRHNPEPVDTTREPLSLFGGGGSFKRMKPDLGPPGKVVIGIDMGSVVTRVAAVQDEEVQTVPTRRGVEALPSFVHIDPSGKTIVGEPAMRRAEESPAYGIRDVRRLMGHPAQSGLVEHVRTQRLFELVEGEEHEAAVRIGAYTISMEEVAALLLKEVREAATLVLPDRVNRAVLTVPGWSGPRVREATRVAGALAGLHVERLVGEASAAAVHYVEQNVRAKGNVLVVSMGAGHLDVVAAHVERGRVHVLAQGGTPHMGGVEFDRALMPLLIEALEDATGERPAETPDFWARLFTAAQAAKDRLSTVQSTEATLIQPLMNGQAFKLSVDLERAKAQQLWAPLVQQVLTEVQQTVDAAGVDSVDRILTVGGATRMPGVQAALRATYPDAVPTQLEAQAPVFGAAWIADKIRRDVEPGLSERLAVGLGMSADSGRRWLFEAGQPLPAELSLSPEAQEIYFFEGAPPQPLGRLLAPDGPIRLSLGADASFSAWGPDGSRLALDPSVDPSALLQRLKGAAMAAAPSNPRHDSGPDGGAEKAGLFGWFRRAFKPR